MDKPTSFANKIISILGSKKFFYIVVAILILSAGWFAITASYPMAFDESFHFGIIQIYAHQWSPLLTSTPPNSGQFGELTHDPSYLYHYLMSFPYRLINLLIHNFVAQIIIMRFLNIGLFVGGLVAFRKLLIKIGASSALTNFSLLMLVLLPVTPFLAAHINYDNMIFLLVPINLSLVLSCVQSISKKHDLGFRNLSLAIILGLLTSLVKYAYLPIFAASMLYIMVVWLINKHRKTIAMSVIKSFKTLRLILKIGLIIALTVSSGLFLQRYAVNLIEFENIQPDCDKVETLENCLEYGPWARNYTLKTTAATSTSRPPHDALPVFLAPWTDALIYRLYFAINYDFREYSPMPLPITMAYIIAITGVILVLVFWRSIILINKHIWLIIAAIILYSLSLLYVNYTEYLSFDKMVAVNGRYFIPLLPFIFVIIGFAYRRFFEKFWSARSTVIKSTLVIIATLLALQGGGILTYLIHSEPVWYWKDDPITGFNTTVQKLVTPLILGAKK